MPNNNEQIVVKPSKWKSFKDTYFLTGSIDIPFLGLTIALLTIGLIMLFSASYPYAYYYKDSSYYYFIRQILFAVAGLVAMKCRQFCRRLVAAVWRSHAGHQPEGP